MQQHTNASIKLLMACFDLCGVLIDYLFLVWQYSCIVHVSLALSSYCIGAFRDRISNSSGIYWWYWRGTEGVRAVHALSISTSCTSCSDGPQRHGGFHTKLSILPNERFYPTVVFDISPYENSRYLGNERLSAQLIHHGDGQRACETGGPSELCPTQHIVYGCIQANASSLAASSSQV